jgi:hypothetical protein
MHEFNCTHPGSASARADGSRATALTIGAALTPVDDGEENYLAPCADGQKQGHKTATHQKG